MALEFAVDPAKNRFQQTGWSQNFKIPFQNYFYKKIRYALFFMGVILKKQHLIQNINQK